MWAVDRGGNLVLLVCYWVDSENFTGNSSIDIGDGCDIYSDDYDIGEISKVNAFLDFSIIRRVCILIAGEAFDRLVEFRFVPILSF